MHTSSYKWKNKFTNKWNCNRQKTTVNNQYIRNCWISRAPWELVETQNGGNGPFQDGTRHWRRCLGSQRENGIRPPPQDDASAVACGRETKGKDGRKPPWEWRSLPSSSHGRWVSAASCCTCWTLLGLSLYKFQHVIVWCLTFQE